ncbi:MAG: SDR family oxidoreductase [Ruminococcaceae bacterium]|nr:SDR family oxidoreductase [Oscillospiraceae bacterium]
MKTVLITGACINTGVDIVKKFASEGYTVVFTGRDPEKVRTAEEGYKNAFPNIPIYGYAIDSILSDGAVNEAGVEALFADLATKNIFVETLVLNAADQGLGMKVFENPLSDFTRVLNTNVVWNFCMAQRAALAMKENGGGNIVFVNSNTAYRAIPDRVAYITAKGAQLGMMRALALDLGKYHIRVNAVLPGMIKTDRWVKNPEFYAKVPSRFTPLGDVADGADIADAVYYFAAHARNTTGAELVVDGGNTIQLYPIIPEV